MLQANAGKSHEYLAIVVLFQAPFIDALEFLNYEPTKEIPSVSFESVDSFGYPHKEIFIKVPDILLPKQVRSLTRI